MAGKQQHGNWRPPPDWAPAAKARYEAGESPREIADTMDGVTIWRVIWALRKAGTGFRTRAEASRLWQERRGRQAR